MVDIPASFCNAVDLQYCLSGVAADFYAVFCAVDDREGVLKVRRSRFYFVWLTSLSLSVTLRMAGLPIWDCCQFPCNGCQKRSIKKWNGR